ncbi:translation initiation factor [Anaeromyxobacter sp. SG64]|uniref:translation initiation factor n=1 Tax=Anaeromyxobacter sp. SG64 TaxID=2925409 RepID=UPI001F56D0B1|nr:translation initiation factor [Anaeromyxobacter sp. SG64]
MGKRDRDEGKPAPQAPFNAALARLRERLPEGWAPPAEAERAEEASAAPPPKGPARAVVRLERKGRGGKEATIVEKLALAPAALSAWADELKRALGCGGAVEEDAIVLQGDQRERARRWLEAKGVRKVILG